MIRTSKAEMLQLMALLTYDPARISIGKSMHPEYPETSLGAAMMTMLYVIWHQHRHVQSAGSPWAFIICICAPDIFIPGSRGGCWEGRQALLPDRIRRSVPD